jgi:hypothetical protein
VSESGSPTGSQPVPANVVPGSPIGIVGNRSRSVPDRFPHAPTKAPPPLFAVPEEDQDDRHPGHVQLLAAARACGWPAVIVEVPSRARPLVIVGIDAAWVAFIRASSPDGRLAAWDALEAWETEMRDRVS